MGLELTTFNIQNFKDRNGVIENLGIENTVAISKDASIARAKAEKEIAIEQANAAKEANDAKIAAQTEIELKKNAFEIKQSELKKAGFVTRDPRMKERKKYGLKKARRAPQFSKR